MTRQTAAHWSGIDAGRRSQLESPVTAVRHFRARLGGVKPSAHRGAANRPAERVLPHRVQRWNPWNALSATPNPKGLASS